MQKIVTVFFSVIVAVAFMAVATGQLQADTTLTYSNFCPPTHHQSLLSESWSKEVEKRTEGRVKIQYFPGQTLTKAKQTYDSVIDGIADIGFSALAYTQGRFPVMATIDLPFPYKTGVKASAIANELYATLMPKEFDDTKVMFFCAHGPGLLHSRDKRVRRLEDVKGLKIRSTGMSAEVVAALGGIPVAMPMPDAYQALQKGVVDGSVHPIEADKGWKLGEVTKFITRSYSAAYTTCFFMVINKNKWNALEVQDQQIIGQINKEWAVKHGEAWDSSDDEGAAFLKTHKGIEYIELDDAEAQRWAAAVAPIIDNYTKKMTAEGFDGKAVVSIIEKALAASP